MYAGRQVICNKGMEKLRMTFSVGSVKSMKHQGKFAARFSPACAIPTSVAGMSAVTGGTSESDLLCSDLCFLRLLLTL